MEVIFSSERQKELQLSPGTFFKLKPPWYESLWKPNYRRFRYGPNMPAIATKFTEIEVIGREEIDKHRLEMIRNLIADIKFDQKMRFEFRC